MLTSDEDLGQRGRDEQQKDLVVRADYSQRHRGLEWRTRWFHLDRSTDDRVLERIIGEALQQKQKQIRQQRGTADHQAAYGPAGPGSPWFSIGPRNVNGRVKSLAVHPTNASIVYAGSASGGVWLSENGGQSWRPLWDSQESLAIGSLAIAPSAPTTIYAGTGEWTPGYLFTYPGAGVYVSTNSGATWTQRAAVHARRIARVLVSPTDPLRVYVAGESGFERSTDGGLTWTTVQPGWISDAVIDPHNADVLYINVVNSGLYKSTNGGTTWTLLAAGPTGAAADWIRLAIGNTGAHSSNFLLAKRSGTLYRSTDGGTTWTTLSGDHGGAPWPGWANLLAVAPDDENIFLAGGVGLERTANGGGSWTAPGGLHSDQHVAVFAPGNPNIVYASNDGGLYRSDNKGVTWQKASHGLVITQFYDVGSWSTISTVAGGGTQDQGTNISTGGLTWRNVLGADGGYFVIHPTDPRTMYFETQNSALFKTTDGAASPPTPVTAGLSGSSPWTGVITIDLLHPHTLFVGTNRVFRTTDGCATPWVAVSQVLAGDVSCIAIAPSDSNRVYAGASGQLYRSDDGGATSPWADKTGTLPSTRPIKDIAVGYTDPDRVAVCYGGTDPSGTAHHVFLSTNGGNGWTDISGNLPNISVNAVALDTNSATTIYVGTDVGVYRTTDGGSSWLAFDNGIPNVIIADLHLDPEDQMLYAATFGRGMYRLDVTPGITKPTVDLYLRDSVLDVGERLPSPGGQPNPLDITDQVDWWESPDIKVENQPFYTLDAVFDGVEFDEEVAHDNPMRTRLNRFYVQVHNRGWQDAHNLSVRAFFADAHAGLPDLPNALVSPAFNLSSTADWTPVGPAQPIALLEPNRPVIVSWDWTVPAGAAEHSCLLAVVSSADDPLTTPETNVNMLVSMEKRVGLKNLHVVDSAGPQMDQTMVSLKFHNAQEVADLIDIVVVPTALTGGNVGLVLEPVTFADERSALDGVTIYPLRADEDLGTWYAPPGSPPVAPPPDLWQRLDRTRLYEFDPTKPSALRGIRLAAKQTLEVLITCRGSRKVPYGQTQQFTVLQRQGGAVVGGSTYELRLRRARGLHPVSRIRVILEKVRILQDNDPWLKGRGEFRFLAAVSFNQEASREHRVRVPESGLLKIGDDPGSNEQVLNICLFDGYVAERDNMQLTLLPVEADLLDPDDVLPLYSREFSHPPEAWVGSYGPDDEAPGGDAERQASWLVWYRIESLPL